MVILVSGGRLEVAGSDTGEKIVLAKQAGIEISLVVIRKHDVHIPLGSVGTGTAWPLHHFLSDEPGRVEGIADPLQEAGFSINPDRDVAIGLVGREVEGQRFLV